MTFMDRTSAAVFQSPSRAEPVSVRHQPLHREARKLRQAVQLLEGGGECVEAAVLRGSARMPTSMRAASFSDCALRSARAQLLCHLVLRVVLGEHPVHLGVSGVLHPGDEVPDAEAVHVVAEAELRLHLVAFRDRHLAHVVAEPRHAQPCESCHAQAARIHTASSSLHVLFLPVTDNDLPLPAHPGADEAELPVAVG